MSAPAIQWYLAREGQQYGPLSEAELAKFIELGHLQPTDLLWREGFPDWRPAMVVFPARAPAPTPRPMPTAPSARRPRPDYGSEPGAVRPSTQPSVARGRQPVDVHKEEQHAEPRARGGVVRRLAVVTIIVGALGAALWIAYPNRARMLEFVSSLTSGGTADRKSLETPPFAGFEGDGKAIDTAMQAAALWRVVKREFPEWYAERLKEVEGMVAGGKDDAAIGQHLARALVALRRQQVNNALSAQIPRLKVIAAAFLENLVQLRKADTNACYAFISQGEASPVIIGLLQGSPHTAHLQAQMVAIMEAVAEGRRSPRVYPQPRQSDYNMLAADLAKLGWTKADMQLFSDERALSRAAPDKVCQLVHDWFVVQLAISDEDAQQRLLVDALRPVVAG